jgi:type IV pilus assembly protein PilY1
MLTSHTRSFRDGVGLSLTVAFAIFGVLQPLSAAAPGTVDLLATPPEITATVPPNLVLTFDDSGSMAWAYMPDRRPLDGGGWGVSTSITTNADNPWFCAGRFDATVNSASNPRSKAMNGMYYDPNVTYRPPLYADGVTEFPQADFFNAWNNGTDHNRPSNPNTSLGTRNLNTSPFCRTAQPAADPAYYQLEGNDFTQDWGDTGLITTNNVWNSAPHLTGFAGNTSSVATGADPRTLTGFNNSTVRVNANRTNPSPNTIPVGGIYEFEDGYLINGNPTIALQPDSSYDAPYIVLYLNTVRCSNVRVSYTLRDLSTNSSATQQLALQARVGTSGNWTNISYYPNLNTNSNTNGSGVLDSSFDDQQKVQVRWITAKTSGASNPIGIDDILVRGTCHPSLVDDNAGYYRLKDSVNLTEDSFGRITTPTSTIYDKDNWEFVPLPISQRQNFANWYSYYRTRTNSAATAMSRAFAPFDENIRLAWQNLGNNANSSTADAPVLVRQSTPIYKFKDEPVNSNVRSRFYDWLFQIPANGGTPNMAASNRVGEYFTGAGGAVDTNPYWDRDLNRELSCRQNFQINMSDGFWNGGNPDVGGTAGNRRYLNSGVTLPDGRAYSTGDVQSSLFHKYSTSGTADLPTMADTMFHYWATDLRPDFAAAASTRLKVPPFIPDRTTNLFGTPIGAGQDPRDNKEVYWNPANDPASWPHLVSFNISFGLDGNLPNTPEVYDALRRGNSSTLAWEYPVVGTDDGRKLDDFWHAALVSRGRFLSAKNPEQLITALQEIIASIVARRGASTAVSVSLPIITDGTTGYTAGYDTSDWAGFVTRNTLDGTTGATVAIQWDAGCKLTGGACASTNQTGLPVRDPDTRNIVTSNGTPGTAHAFRWTNLSARQQQRLNVDPSTIRLDLGTWTADTFGPQRVDYVRGSRVNESTASPRFRQRSSLLGAVIRGQPVYVSTPISGHRDNFPTGSPEDLGTSYAVFQNAQASRTPHIYVAANDGMLHSFRASDGYEQFAYVPNAVIENFRLTKSTQFESGFTPTVDDKPIVYDAYLGGSWKTVLISPLRLGARGVYALDITNPTNVQPMWEFTDVAPAGDTAVDCAQGARRCSSLGYTYESVNLARIKYQDKWVALVSSGYFPKDPLDPASTSAAAARTSLLVIDLATGVLIKEIRTTSAPQPFATSFGLSQPIVYNFGTDAVADIAVAGDLAGNLFRFDLSSDNPSNWHVDLMFQTYGNGGATNAGEQPISSAPISLADPVTGGPIFVLGTGKFLGLPDRSAAIPEQSFYGIRDYGTCEGASTPLPCSNYPIKVNQLVTQTMTQDANAIRKVTTNNPIPATKRGWRIRMNIASEPGERNFQIPYPFYSSNQVLLRSIIPKGVDPCDPGARYGLMVVNAADGTAKVYAGDANPSRNVGGVISSSSPPGDPIVLRGGGTTLIPLGAEALNPDNEAVLDVLTGGSDGGGPGGVLPSEVWHRGAWRELLNPQ